MTDACDAAGVPLWVAYYPRALPRFEHVRHLLAKGAIGEARRHSVRFQPPDPRRGRTSPDCRAAVGSSTPPATHWTGWTICLARFAMCAEGQSGTAARWRTRSRSATDAAMGSRAPVPGASMPRPSTTGPPS